MLHDHSYIYIYIDSHQEKDWQFQVPPPPRPLPGKVQMFLVERIPFEASGPEIGVQGRGLFVVQPALSNWVLSWGKLKGYLRNASLRSYFGSSLNRLSATFCPSDHF